MIKLAKSNSTVEASAAIYNRWILACYDFYVLTFSNYLVWKCPTTLIKKFYNDNISNNHLDIGVGTGYFLDKCQFPLPNPKITLLDLNPNCLQITAKRIARYQPKAYLANILNNFLLNNERFDSIGINYLLHCLPGNFSSKAAVFQNIKPYLNSGATVFGSTILGKHPKNFLAKQLLKIYNAKGIMGNNQDTRKDLEIVLSQHFNSYSIWEVGMVAFFVAKNMK